MGFIDTLGTFGDDVEGAESFPVFYNVAHAVGENCPNRREDVMLVQYLLFWAYHPYPKSFHPKGEMKIDGACGGITKNWILKFQLDGMYSNASIRADKRVDRIRNKDGMFGRQSNTIYTLAYLNWFVAHDEPEAFAKLFMTVPLENIGSIPPPSNDIVVPEPPPLVYAVGGL